MFSLSNLTGGGDLNASSSASTGPQFTSTGGSVTVTGGGGNLSSLPMQMGNPNTQALGFLGQKPVQGNEITAYAPFIIVALVALIIALFLARRG
jgi:hypothetical protein